MKNLLAVFLLTLLTIGVSLPAETAPGRMTGGKKYELPDWFKQSFLDIREEAGEARAGGRHVLIFMELDECPYCVRMLDENFRQGETREFIQQNFIVIGMNVRGAREVVWIDGVTYTEQALARKLKSWGTPALLFIDPDGKKVLHLNGYRTPPALRHALEYVRTRAYRDRSLSAYIEMKQPAPVYVFREHARFEKVTDFTDASKPWAFIFEDRHCSDCAGFHDKLLNHPEVLAELKPFRVVRLDAYADTPITDVSGKRTTPRAWAAALGLTYRPAVVLFDAGKEAVRSEARLYHFHFREMLRFVSGRHYLRYERFGAYLAERQSTLLQQGIDIDFGE